MRDSQHTLFEAFLQKEQIGGRKAVPVNLGMHMGRACLRSRKAIGLFGFEGGLLSHHTTALCRRSHIGCSSDALLSKVCARFGLPPEALHDLHRHLRSPASVHTANLPHHAANAIRASMWTPFSKSVDSVTTAGRSWEPVQEIAMLM